MKIASKNEANHEEHQARKGPDEYASYIWKASQIGVWLICSQDVFHSPTSTHGFLGVFDVMDGIVEPYFFAAAWFGAKENVFFCCNKFLLRHHVASCRDTLPAYSTYRRALRSLHVFTRIHKVFF